MSNNRLELSEQICDVCHKMWQLGWVAANDGNVSAVLDDAGFVCMGLVRKPYRGQDDCIHLSDGEFGDRKLGS